MPEPAKAAPTPIDKHAHPKSEYAYVELVEAIPNCSKRDRTTQRVAQIRPDADVFLKEHAHGVEICGNGSWTGVVPWTNIKYAKKV